MNTLTTNTPAFVYDSAKKIMQLIEKMSESKWTLELADEIMGASDIFCVLNSPFLYPTHEAMEKEMKRRIARDAALQESSIYGDIATRRLRAMSEALNIYNQIKKEHVTANN